MARGRMYAKTVSTSRRYNLLYETAGKLAEFCQALYPLLIAHADDSGRLQGDVETVRLAVCPGTPRSNKAIEEALTHLHTVKLIGWYEVEGRKVIQVIDFAEYQPGLKNRGNSKFPEMPRNAVVCRGMPSELKGTEQNRTEGKGTVAGAPLAAVAAEPDPSGELSAKAVVTIWNEEIVPGSTLAPCRGLSDGRRKHVNARLTKHGLAEVRRTMLKARDSPFCNGQNNRGWVLSFDWLMESPDNFLKVSEGKYDDHKATGTDGRGRTGAPMKGKYDGLEEHD